MAQSGLSEMFAFCPLSGAKRTYMGVWLPLRLS
jgi:hypothetical protein